MTNEQIDKIIANLQAVKAGKKIIGTHGIAWRQMDLDSLFLDTILHCEIEPPKPIERWLVVKQPHNNEICYGSEAMAKVFSEEFGGRIIHMREVVEEKPIG